MKLSKHILIPLFILVGWAILLNFLLAKQEITATLILLAIAPALLLLVYLFSEPDIFLFSIIFFVPLSIKLDLPGGFALSFPSEVLVVLMAGYIILHLWRLNIPDRRIFSHPIFYLICIQITWLLVTSGLSSHPLVSFKRVLIQILYFLVFYLMFLTRFNKHEHILKFYLLYALGLIIPIINGMIWHSQYNFNPQASYYMPQPFFIEHTIYGAAINFVLPPLFYLALIPNAFVRNKTHKMIIGLLFLLCITGEFLSFSRAAWVSLLSIPVFLLLVRYRVNMIYPLFIIAFVIIVTLFFNQQLTDLLSRNEARSNRGNLKEQVESVSNIQTDISNVERINRWKCAIRMYEKEPLKGYGPGTYQFVYGGFQVRKEMTRISTYHGEKGNAHSEYLGAMAETGLPGLLIYLLIIGTTLFTAVKIIYKSHDPKTRTITILITLCLLPFLIHTVFNAFMENDEIGSLWYGSLAAITAMDVYFFRRERGYEGMRV